MSNNTSFLVTVPYKLFDKWYVELYINQKEYNSVYNMLLVKELITPVKRVIKKNDYNGMLSIVSKIVFKTGEIIFRKENKTGMDLLEVHKGDLLVSSINFHQGAVALNNIGDFVCSTHYQTYEINTELVIPQYLLLVFRTTKFIEMVAGIKANGIKNESGYDFIGGFRIPVPPKSKQQELIDEYYRLLNQAVEFRKQADDYFVFSLTNIQKKISTYEKNASSVDNSDLLLSIIPFTSTNRWEVGYIYKEGLIDSVVSSFKYSFKSIGELQIETLFGLSVKASIEQKDGMIPVLRMSNIQNGELHYDDLKFLPSNCAMTSKEPDKWILRKGDFLIVRTNGSKDLVGKAAVFDSNETYTYASYLIRYRFNLKVVLPEYVNIVFMMPIVREQIAVMRRQGGGQYNLNSDEINAIKIPVPNITIQETLIKQYNDSLKETKRLLKQSRDSVEQAEKHLVSTLFIEN